MINDEPIRWISITLLLLFIGGCSSLPSSETRVDSFHVSETANTRLGKNVQPLLASHPDQSGFYALIDGIDAFAMRLRLINAADKALDLQYYIWHDDLTGRVLHNQLLEAADRGVRVRLLLDDLDTAGKDKLLRIIDAHPKVEVRLFNPFANRNSRWKDFIGDTSRINHRMHNKTLTADNQASIFGGRNIGDEYFDATREVGFSDMDVLAVGPVVNEVSQAFDIYWNSQWTYPLSAFYGDKPIKPGIVESFKADSDKYLEKEKSSDYATALQNLEISQIDNLDKLAFSWGNWKLIYDHPSKITADEIKKETHLAPSLKQAMDRTQHELIIVSPYFVPGEQFTDYLVNKVKQGTSVHILTNSLAANDVPMVHAGYMRYRKALIEGGVELYEYKPNKTTSKEKLNKTKPKWSGSSRASLHGKYLGFDHRYVFIGSFNLDSRSVTLNTELGVFFESPKYAMMLSKAFKQDVLKKAYHVDLDEDGELQWSTIEDGETLKYMTEPETGFWQRFITGFMSLFVPESQL